MEFCKRCGKRLNSNIQPNILVCSICGNEETPEREGKPSSNITRQSSVESVVVIDREEVGSYVQPTVKAECPKCNNRRAYTRTIEVGEDGAIEIQVFSCTRCGHNWRKRG